MDVAADVRHLLAPPLSAAHGGSVFEQKHWIFFGQANDRDGMARGQE
jgi:hypothetical protein